MNEREFAELAAGYALDALSPEDERTFAQARAQHPEWDHYVADDVATVAALAEGAPAVPPPAEIRAAVLARIASSGSGGEDGAAEVPAPSARRWGPRVWFVLAASLALLVGLGAGAVLIGQQLNPESVMALREIESAPDAQAATATVPGGGEVTAHWSESLGKAVVVAEDLPSIAQDESYQLWLVREGGAPVSAGVLPAGGSSATELLADPVAPGDVIAVTREQAGGSPTGQPTTDPILAIETG